MRTDEPAGSETGAEPDEPEGERETGRLEAFSDGVFAIAITLLILTIQVPPSDKTADKQLAARLLDSWPSYAAYLISFAFILIMWINHHNLFRLIHRTDQTFLLLNGLLLLFVTFVPFPTALLAQYITSQSEDNQKVAALVFNGTYVLLATAFNLLWRYASHGRRLLGKRADPQVVADVNRRFSFGPVYVVCFLLAFWNAWAALALNVAIAAFYALPGRASRISRTGAGRAEGVV